MTQEQKAAGTPDPDFGTNSVVRLPFDNIVGSIPQAVLPQPDNKLLVAIATTPLQNAPAKIARLNGNGSLDLTFATRGIAEIPFEEGTLFKPRHLHPLPNEGWLITGTAESEAKPGADLAVVRQLADGRLDPNFGDAGRVILNIYELVGASLLTHRHDHDKKCGDSLAQSAGDIGAISFSQQDGMIFLTATVIYDYNDLQGIVICLNADGSLNLDFNHKGVVLVELPGIKRVWNEASGVAVQPDGKVLVCGNFVRTHDDILPDAFVTRYHPNGNIDSAYGDQNNGTVIIADAQKNLELVSMTIKPDSGIIATGSASIGLEPIGLIVSLNPNGSFNLVFNQGKPLFSDFLAKGVSWRRSFLQGDGKIIVMGQGGSSLLDENSSMVTARYLAHGPLDTAFNGGWVEFNDKNEFDVFRGGALMSQNRVVVCGYAFDSFNPIRGSVVRYLR